jgi:hypothetical protein
LNDDALLSGQESFVENFAFIFRIEMEDGAAVLQERRYESAKIQGVTKDYYFRDAPDTY